MESGAWLTALTSSKILNTLMLKSLSAGWLNMRVAANGDALNCSKAFLSSKNKYRRLRFFHSSAILSTGSPRG